MVNIVISWFAISCWEDDIYEMLFIYNENYKRYFGKILLKRELAKYESV